MRARATNVPLTTAHAMASPMATSGSAGFSGGLLPVAAFQPVSSAFFATAAPIRAETSEKTVQSLLEEPESAMEAGYRGTGTAGPPGGASVSAPSRSR